MPRVLAAATAALAASVAALVVWRGRTAPEVPSATGPAPIIAPGTIAAPSARLAPTREVELYTWANRNQRRPETAAGAVLCTGGRSRRRPAAVEILALDLANATPEMAEEFEPLARLHESPPRGRGRIERHGRRSHPAVPRT